MTAATLGMWNHLAECWAPWDPFRPHPVRLYYEAKHAVAQRLSPASILEIGVRAGYSALAFLWAVPSSEYLGLDAQTEDYEQSTDLAEHAARILTPYDARFQHVDTQTLDRLPLTRDGGPFDLVHVDGDHSREGAEHDIRLALDSGASWVLVDDYDDIPAVCEACEAVVAGRDDLTIEHIPDPLRGSLLIGRAA